MTVLKDVERAAKASFTAEMKKLGFEKRFSFYYFRQRGEIYDIFTGWFLSSGVTFRVKAYCWLPEVNPDINMDRFPHGTSMAVGGALSEDGIYPESGCDWSLEWPEDIAPSLEKMLHQLKTAALPWMEKHVVTRQDFVDHYNINAKCRPDWPEREAKILQKQNA